MKTNDKAVFRIIFMGTSAFAEQILAALIEASYGIISVYTQPDKKVGRSQALQKSPVKILAEKFNIPVFTPNKLSADVAWEIKTQKPDLILVAAYGKIIPKSILELPGFGAINVHGSLLPKYRGASPIQNAILAGETETGTTIMLMDEGIDTGDILSQRSLAIGKNETSFELSKKLADISSQLLLETLPLWIEYKIIPQKQDDAKTTSCKLIKREDGKISWDDEAQSIYNRWRAFYPWPGIFTFWERQGKVQRVKLNKINFMSDSLENHQPAGKVLQVENAVGVQTAEGIVILKEVQLEGKPPVKIENFLNGYPDFIGSILR